MAEKLSSKFEKGSVWFRNLSLGAAAVELAIATAVPETAPILVPLAAFNIAQAGLAEVVRRISKPRSKSQSAAA